jgi:hypothetical protein
VVQAVAVQLVLQVLLILVAVQGLNALIMDQVVVLDT